MAESYLEDSPCGWCMDGPPYSEMCWNECWRDSECGVCVCDGKSGAVGEDPGLSECNEWSEGLLLSEDSVGGKCECIPVVVGDVIMILGLSLWSSRSLGNAIGTNIS
jgi:hypothetical protein